MPLIERARAWCERGVAEYLASGTKSAFPSWEKAGEYLFVLRVRVDVRAISLEEARAADEAVDS